MQSRKQKERYLVEVFKDFYKGIPFEIAEESESPDFILTLDGKRIGLEITEIYQDSMRGPSRLKQRSSDNGLFTEELIELLKHKIAFTFSIGIHFNVALPIAKAKKRELLLKLEDKCVGVMSNMENREHLELDHYYDELPDEIRSIRIFRYDGMDDSFDYRPEGGTLPRLSLEHVRACIDRKEDKLASYLSCDAHWLLIREGDYFSGTFSEIDLKAPINSLFDKVFLLRTQKGELIELK